MGSVVGWWAIGQMLSTRPDTRTLSSLTYAIIH
jgi:hypothetical protein